MPWQPKRAGPGNIRELYHWVWGQLNDLGAIVGGNTPSNLHASLTDVTADQHHPQLHDLTSHTDVTIATPLDGQILSYDNGTSQWKNVPASSEVDTLDSVTTRGNTTTNAITVAGFTSTGIDDNAASTAIEIAASNQVQINSQTIANGSLQIKGYDTGFGHLNIAVMHSAATAGWVSAVTSTTVALTNSSDRRLKEDIQDYDASEAMDALESVAVRDYRWKESQERQVGFIADELQDALPYLEVVQGDREGDQMQTINTAGLIPMLWAQNRELLRRIEALETNEE